MSMSSAMLRREEEEAQLSYSASSPFKLRNVSPIQSKYRDSEGNEIPIYRTSCPDCHSHVKEMIRIHELWQITKKDLRESRRAHENLLKEYKEEVDKTARQHQRIVDGFHDEIESLRADLRVKVEQVANLRHESSAIQQTCNDLNSQLSLTHEKYAEAVSQNSVMGIRTRELEQALTQFRLEKESVFDQTVHQLREEVRTVTHETERRGVDLQAREREIQTLQEIIENQNQDILRFKSVERKQNDLFEAGSDERSRLAATVRQQQTQLEDRAQEIRSLQSQLAQQKSHLDQQKAHLEQEESESASLRQQVRDLRNMEEQMETQALGEFRRSRRHIEERLEKLQTECASVANMMTPARPTATSGGFGTGVDAGERLPDWLPPAVSGLVRSFRASLLEGGRNVGEEMSSFLIALNRIWRERLEEKLRQVRLHHAADIRELKRRLAQRIPYEQVVMRSRIIRLQKSLDTTRAVHLKAKGDQSQGLLDLSLSTVENLSRQILEYEKENNLLKSQISLLLNDKSAAGAKQNAGVQWVATSTIQAVNTLGDQLWTSANSYMDRTIRLAQGTDIGSRLSAECQRFLDSLEMDIRSAKSSIKRALAEADADEWTASNENDREQE